MDSASSLMFAPSNWTPYPKLGCNIHLSYGLSVLAEVCPIKWNLLDSELSYNEVQGEKKLSKLEDAKLEKKLKLLNKPAVKIVKMKPTVPSRIKRNPYASAMSRLPTIWSKDRGCPSRTVPVKRITKDDLIRQRDMSLPEPINFKDQRAILQTLEDPNAKFSGAGMAPNLFNPHVEGKQHSGCRIRILRGSDSMQVGWRTGNTHCFNTLCPGFVHVNTDFTLDMPFDTLSQPGGPSWEVPMYLYRDHGTGNWWLLIGPDFASIGFWPHKIFTLLKSYASTVQWGGVVYSPPGVPGPPMGASLFPSGDATKDAYCRSITVSNEEGDSVGIVEAIRRTDNYFDYEILFKRIEMKPSLSRIKQNSDDSTPNRPSIIWPKDGDCPSGIVPVKRITKDDLIRRRSIPTREDVKVDDQFLAVR
ncbi:hypothetical protein FXO37_08053 [Capsicum annuum]|nr:hypothetical protein FXO37_08053 [Capsicum annuum]